MKPLYKYEDWKLYTSNKAIHIIHCLCTTKFKNELRKRTIMVYLHGGIESINPQISVKDILK